MKFALEASLIIILLVLMYNSPNALKDFAGSVLGKMISLGIIAYIAMTHGRNTGLIAAFIFIILIHNEKEGLENPPKATKKNKEIAKLKSENSKLQKELKKDDATKETATKETATKETATKEGLGRSSMLKPKAVVSQKNIVDEDRKRKVNALLKSQEARGQFGGESKGMVGKPEI